LTKMLLFSMSTAAGEVAWVGVVIGVAWTVLSRAVRRIEEGGGGAFMEILVGGE
jgi:hypothetical protein